MPTIDELFATMETNSIYEDAHDIIHIDPVTRQLHIPGTELVLGVEGDNKGERKYFCCTSVVGNGVALNACSLRVHYVNAAGEHGKFRVTDIVQDGNSVVFSWEISEKVTRKAGDVSFVVCVCKDVDGETVNEWSTTTTTARVLPGIDTPVNVDEDEDYGGAGGEAAPSSLEYIFNTTAYGVDSRYFVHYDPPPDGLFDMTVDDIDAEVSAPWETMATRTYVHLRLSPDELLYENTLFGYDAGWMVLRLVVPSAGTYIPKLRYRTSEYGMCVATYLSKMTAEDEALRMTYDTTEGDSAYQSICNAAQQRVDNMESTETLGTVDTYGAEATDSEYIFGEVKLDAGDYLLMLWYDGHDNRIDDSMDALDCHLKSFMLEGVMPPEPWRPNELDKHIADTNNPHGVTAEQVGAATAQDVEEALKSYIKNTDYATKEKAGAVKISHGYGISIDSSGMLKVLDATNAEIDGRQNEYKPITPNNLEYAVKSVGDGYYATAEQIGDISAALDELHAYAQSLIGGEA